MSETRRATQPVADAGEQEPEVVRLRRVIARAARALIGEIGDTSSAIICEAWHQLYAAADPTYSKPGGGLGDVLDVWDPPAPSEPKEQP